jgi:F-type H+-transporting ATPase subunit a
MIIPLASSGGEIDIPHHMLDPRLWHVAGDIWFTKQMLVMTIATFVVAVVAVAAARRTRMVPRGITNVIEPVLLFLRDEVVYTVMSKKQGERLLPFFWTLFFFILANNLAGLVPFSATPTGNISTTAALSLMALFVITALGIVRHGVAGYVASIVPDVPKPLWPFLLVIEIIGIFAKHFALAVRLLANMIAGHLVILAFLGMIFMFKSIAIGGVITAAVVGLYILEIFIAFLQAYIFTFLTAMFLGAAVEGH